VRMLKLLAATNLSKSLIDSISASQRKLLRSSDVEVIVERVK
jgi:hypothetical protein